MAHPRCLAHSPARALHRVLVSDLASSPATPSLSLSARHASTYYLFPPRLFSSRNRLPTHKPPFAAAIAAPATPTQHVRRLTTTPALQRINVSKKRPINNQIPYQWVRIASAPPDSTLSPPQRTDSVLRSLNPKTHTLVMVAPPPTPPEGEEQPATLDAMEPRAAICRIVDRAAAEAAAAEAEKQARRKAVDTKELELSWSIAGHDLGHKLRRLREFLDKGLNVEVIMAKKRGGRAATREEAEGVLAQVRGAVASVDGAKESRKMDGSVNGMARLFFEGPSEKKRKKRKQEQELEQSQEG
ncbi:hypothetical protein F5Y05DRAFT_348593 [Hypoxylon sp. FL0543]|nr:hypothetical protein F5Y05DRAFT_348593 [Hypoxylon sp. FL0543]